MRRLAGRTALISGAATGMGRATAELFAEEGADVVLFGLGEEMEVAACRNGTTRDQEFAALTERIALRRVAEPTEIATCCLFLASDEASFVTGAVLVADGGGRSPTHNRAV